MHYFYYVLGINRYKQKFWVLSYFTSAFVEREQGREWRTIERKTKGETEKRRQEEGYKLIPLLPTWRERTLATFPALIFPVTRTHWWNGYLKQKWETLRTLYCVKEARHKRPRIVRLHLYEIPSTGYSRDGTQINGCWGLGEREQRVAAWLVWGFLAGWRIGSGTRQWWWLYSSVSELNATEWYTWNWYIAWYV